MIRPVADDPVTGVGVKREKVNAQARMTRVRGAVPYTAPSSTFEYHTCAASIARQPDLSIPPTHEPK